MYKFHRHDVLDIDFYFDIFFVWLAFKIYNSHRFGSSAVFGKIHINILHIRTVMDSKIIVGPVSRVFNDNLLYDVIVI